ncbi:MAG: DUF1611 domain-containing protein [bacterium]|nr:DUF1611 domain-containing protein [bacterium]
MTQTDQFAVKLRAPYILFVGGETRPPFAKTAFGVLHWRPELCIGQMRLTPDAVDLGLPDVPPGSAAAAGAESVMIGTASIGGAFPPDWIAPLTRAARDGVDIVAGLHTPLSDVAELVHAAQVSGARLVDVRIPPPNLPVGTGKRRTGHRLLTVGTDCAVGKKYTALQLEADMKSHGAEVDYRASGQTGIMIAGRGLAVDAVVSDFLSGAAEVLSPDAAPRHWDVIEGQGSIFHPGYAAVSHGLLIGSQPDAFVVCHEAGRKTVSGWDDFPLPTIRRLIERTAAIGRLTNPEIACVGISVNTRSLSDAEAAAFLQDLAAIHDLPCVDPIRTGTGAIVDEIQRRFGPFPNA